MSGFRQKLAGSILLVALLGLSLWAASGCYSRAREESARKTDLFRLSDRISTLRVENTPEGLRFAFERRGGTTMLTPEEFTREVQTKNRQKRAGGLFFRIFDITSMTSFFWVALGLLGQFLFTGRMLLQWWVSEKQKQSIVPTNFWWLSLWGSSLLIIYFSWRVDIVGVLGQSTGWFVYTRNLWFIYRHNKTPERKGK